MISIILCTSTRIILQKWSTLFIFVLFVGMWFDRIGNFCHVATAQLQISWVNMITTVSWYATYAVIRMIWSNLYSWLHTLLMCNHYKTRNCLFMTTTNRCTRYKEVISFGYIKQDALLHNELQIRFDYEKLFNFFHENKKSYS